MVGPCKKSWVPLPIRGRRRRRRRRRGRKRRRRRKKEGGKDIFLRVLMTSPSLNHPNYITPFLQEETRFLRFLFCTFGAPETAQPLFFSVIKNGAALTVPRAGNPLRFGAARLPTGCARRGRVPVRRSRVAPARPMRRRRGFAGRLAFFPTREQVVLEIPQREALLR